MARKAVPILIFVVIVLVVLSITQQMEINRLQKTIAKYEQKDLQDKIREFISLLAIPSEALYYDKEVMRKVAQLRFDSYVRHGTPYFTTYGSILGFLRTEDFLQNSKYNWQKRHQHLELDKHDSSSINGDSFENYLQNLQHMHLNYFASELENYPQEYTVKYGRGLGSHFKDHPDQFERFVKPWVTRSLGGYHNWTKLAACRLLLAWGDRTDNIKTTLQQVISTQHPNDAEKAKELAVKYKLELELY